MKAWILGGVGAAFVLVATLAFAPVHAHDVPDIFLNVTAHDAGPCTGESQCWFTVAKNEPDTSTNTARDPTFNLTRGATVHVTFENAASSAASHSLKIGGIGAGVDPVASGNSETFTFQVPWDAPEDARYWCGVPGHDDYMNGTHHQLGSNTAPQLSITDPGEGATVDGTVTLAGDTLDEEGDAVRVQVRTPGSPTWKEAERGWTYSWDTTQVADGNHTVEVRASDQHGFTTYANRTVQVANDRNEAPSVTFESPPPAAEVAGTVTVEGAANDPDGEVVRLEAKVPPAIQEYRPVEGTRTWAFEWNTSRVDPGFYNVTVRAVDDENASTTARLPLEVVNASANRGPRLTLSHPASGEAVDGRVRVAGNATDPDGDPVTVEVLPPTAATWQAVQGADDAGVWTFTWNASGLEAGTYTVEVRAGDGDDRVRRNLTVAVREEGNRPPSLTFVEPDRDAAVRGRVTVLLESADVDEGDRVETVRVRFADQEAFRQASPRTGDRWRVHLSAEDLPRGPAKITAVASDGQAVSRAVLPVRIPAGPPSAAPTVNVTRKPPDRAVGLVSIRGQVSDREVQSPPITVELRVSGELADLVEQSEPGTFTVSWNARRTEPGVHDVTVQAFDGSAASKPVTFAVRVVTEAAAQAEGGTQSAPAPGAAVAALAGCAAAAIRRR